MPDPKVIAKSHDFNLFVVGGSCLIRGCLPGKLILFAWEFPGLMRDAEA